MFMRHLIHELLEFFLIPLPPNVDLPQAAEIKAALTEEAKEVEGCRSATTRVAFVIWGCN